MLGNKVWRSLGWSRWCLAVAALVALFGLLACGGNAPDTGATAPAVAQPNSTVAVMEPNVAATAGPGVVEATDVPLAEVKPVAPLVNQEIPTGTPEGKAEPTYQMPAPTVQMVEVTPAASAMAGDSAMGAVGDTNEAMVMAMQDGGSPPAVYRSGGLPPEAGGEANPNDEKLPLVYFENYGVNPFVDADEDHLSTFALDGDTGSYDIGKSYLNQGWLPEPDSVRVEEWVNAFDQGYDGPESGLGLVLDGGPSRFGEAGYQLLRVGVAAAQPSGPREPVSLVFVVDVSGSMAADNRLEVAKYMMVEILAGLVPGDRVALVTYGYDVAVPVAFTDGDQWETVVDAVRRLEPDGATFVEGGIRKAFELGQPELAAGRPVRVVVFSDGVGNLGETGADNILALVDEQALRGVSMHSVGVGRTGNYNDVMLEVLANRGNGVYFYVADRDEAGLFLTEKVESLFREVARDARVQVEFNPAVVRKYRLLGYENRAVADTDFRADTLDFGEIGFANDVTALYEIRLERDADDQAPLATARLRWWDVERGEVVEIDESIRLGDFARSWDDGLVHWRRAAVVAEFAELMGRSFWAQCSHVDDVLTLARWLDTGDGMDDELTRLVKQSQGVFEPYCKK